MRTMQVVAQIPYLMTVAWAAGLDAASFLQVAANGGATDAGKTAPVKELGEAALDFMKEQGDLMKEQVGFMKEQESILADIVEMKNEEDEGGREPPVEGGVARKGRASSDGSLEAGEEEVGEQEEAHAAQHRTQAVEHIAGGRVLGEINQSDPWASTTVSFLDFTTTDPALTGFNSGFADSTYGYVVPYYNGASFFGKVARFDLAGFAAVAVLDLTATHPALKGFNGGFTDGTYGYVVPNFDGADYNGKVARFDLAGFAAVAVLDLTATHPALKGFCGGFADGTYGYVVPTINTAGYSGGKVARFDLAGFTAVAVLDLTATDTALKGFRGGFTDGTYGYVVPNNNGASFLGTVTRFDLAGFAAVAVLDLTSTHPALKGFHGGFADGTYGYVVPSTNSNSYSGGKVARFDLAGFAAVAVLDLTATDTALKGFNGGFADGTYGYVVPRHNGAFFGKVARFDLAGFAAVAVLDLAATDATLTGFDDGFIGGTYGYAVQYNTGKVARFGVSAAANDPGDQTSVVGDPHVVNVARVKFEIRRAGVHKLVQIPQVIRSNEKPDLRVDAEVQHLASHDCDKSFLTSLTVFGQWTEDIFGLLRISPGSDAPNTSLLVHTQFARPEVIPRPEVKAGRHSLTFKLRDVAFHVGKHYEGRYGKQRAYLNVRIAGLKKYKDLGGLLGYDDHGDAEKPSADCAAPQPPPASRSSFVGSGRSAPGTAGGSRIEAE